MSYFDMPLIIPILATAYVLGIYVMLHFAGRNATASHTPQQKIQ